MSKIDYSKVFKTISYLCEEGISVYKTESHRCNYQRVLMNYKYYIEYLERFLSNKNQDTFNTMTRYYEKCYPRDRMNVNLYYFPHLEVVQYSVYGNESGSYPIALGKKKKIKLEGAGKFKKIFTGNELEVYEYRETRLVEDLNIQTN